MGEEQNKPTETGEAVAPVVTATPGAYFRQRNEKDKLGEPITIGDVTFYVGRPSLTALTKQGIIPSDVAAQATNTQQKMVKSRPITAQELDKYNEFVRLMIMNSVRAPKIVEKDANYDSNEINFDDLNDFEQTELMVFIQGGVEALRSFRVERQRQIARFSSEALSDDEA